MFLFGCAPAHHSVEGTWNLAKPGGPGDSTTFVFNKDGTYQRSQHAAFASIHSHQLSSGTYSFSGSTLTLNTTKEVIGIDSDTAAAIDAREAKAHPHLHIAQDKSDVPVKIEQSTTSYHITFIDSSDKAKFKDLTNYADHGVLYIRASDGT
jgi:hypothetical protein